MSDRPRPASGKAQSDTTSCSAPVAIRLLLNEDSELSPRHGGAAPALEARRAQARRARGCCAPTARAAVAALSHPITAWPQQCTCTTGTVVQSGGPPTHTSTGRNPRAASSARCGRGDRLAGPCLLRVLRRGRLLPRLADAGWATCSRRRRGDPPRAALTAPSRAPIVESPATRPLHAQAPLGGQRPRVRWITRPPTRARRRALVLPATTPALPAPRHATLRPATRGCARPRAFNRRRRESRSRPQRRDQTAKLARVTAPTSASNGRSPRAPGSARRTRDASWVAEPLRHADRREHPTMRTSRHHSNARGRAAGEQPHHDEHARRRRTTRCPRPDPERPDDSASSSTLVASPRPRGEVAVVTRARRDDHEDQ